MLRSTARWVARVLGTLAALTFLVFLIGEGFGPRGLGTINPPDLFLICLRLAACVGLLVAWKHETLGAACALACIAAATFLRPWAPLMTAAIAVPAVLFLLMNLKRPPRYHQNSE